MLDSIVFFFSFSFCFNVISNSMRVQITVVPVGSPKIHLFPISLLMYEIQKLVQHEPSPDYLCTTTKHGFIYLGAVLMCLSLL